MRDDEIKNRWSAPERRQKLQDSFAYIAVWADEAMVGIVSSKEIQAIKLAAIHMEASLLPGINLQDQLRHPGGLRHELQLLVDFEKVLKKRPENDPHRTDPTLRTALRRASQFLCAEGADCQFC